MSDFNYRATEIVGVGIDSKHGDAVIVASIGEVGELTLAFPLDDAPQLVTLLSRGLAQANSGLGQDDLQTSLILSDAQFVGDPGQTPLSFVATLSSGLPVAFSIPKGKAVALRKQLDAWIDGQQA